MRILFTCIFISCLARGFAADFELSRPTIELRRLQFCGECREPLVVTSIATGAAVRCPKCATVARRLPDRELLVKVYQVCASCAARLDVAPMQPDAPLRCGACGLAQRVMPEAIYQPPTNAGIGEIPEGEIVAPLKKNSPPSSVNKSIDENTETSAPQIDIIPLPPIDDSLKVSVLVNGQPVSTAEVQKTVQRNLELLQLRGGTKPTPEELAQLRQSIIEQLIEREILRQAAARLGFAPPETEVQARLAVAPNTLTRAGVQAEIIAEEMKKRTRSPAPNPTAEAIAAYYDEHQAEFTISPRLQLRALTIYKNREGRADQRAAATIAQEVKEQLDFGIKFAAVAARYSEDVFRTEGGILRNSNGDETIAAEELAAPLAQELTSVTATGKIFGPVELPTTFAFCEVAAITPAKIIPLAEVQAQIRRQLQRQNTDIAFTAWLEKLKKAAVVEFQ